MNGVGNTHLVGEFNFYGDPEGAKMVLDEYTPLVSYLFPTNQTNYSDDYKQGTPDKTFELSYLKSSIYQKNRTNKVTYLPTFRRLD